jgi:hypothetical protein
MVTPSLAASAEMWRSLWSLQCLGAPVEDPLQKARVQFWRSQEGLCLELIEPLGPDSPVARTALQGGGLHHCCWQTRSLDDFSAWSRSQGFQVVSPPKLACAMGSQRRVAFAFGQGLGLFELVETEGAPGLGPLQLQPAQQLVREALRGLRG